MCNQTQDRAIPFTQKEAQAIDFQTEFHSLGHFGSLLHKTSELYHVNVKKTAKKSGNNCSDAENFIRTLDVYTTNV